MRRVGLECALNGVFWTLIGGDQGGCGRVGADLCAWWQ